MALAVLCVMVLGACGSDAEPPAEVEPEEEVVELNDPTPFDLPDDCEELEDFAIEARQAYDDAEVGTQDLVDAKARFDGAINQQMLLGCV